MWIFLVTKKHLRKSERSALLLRGGQTLTEWVIADTDDLCPAPPPAVTSHWNGARAGASTWKKTSPPSEVFQKSPAEPTISCFCQSDPEGRPDLPTDQSARCQWNQGQGRTCAPIQSTSVTTGPGDPREAARARVCVCRNKP